MTILFFNFYFLRPFNNSEQNYQSTTVLDIPNNKEIIVHERPNDKISKKFKFNNVFGPLSKQVCLWLIFSFPIKKLLHETIAKIVIFWNCGMWT